MQRIIAMNMLAAILLVSASGCGTMANLGGNDDWLVIAVPARPPMPFGGVCNDVGIIAKAQRNYDHVSNDDSEQKGGVRYYLGAAAGSALLLADMTFCLAADIVTLPWVTYVFVRETLSPSGDYDFKARDTIRPITPVPIPEPSRVDPPPQVSAR